MFWGFGCDIFGRKLGFNLTLGVTAVFGLIASSSPNFAAIGVFAALWSFGVGGNLPVDSAVFLEFLPGSHQYLLTVLSVDWAIAQLVATLVAWPILGNLTCQEGETCTRSKNMGWRYFVIAMGGISMVEFFIRFALFTVYESPKYLMGKGRDEEAVKIVHEVARRNGKTSNRKSLCPPSYQVFVRPNIRIVSIEDLRACDPHGTLVQIDTSAAIKRNVEKLSLKHVRALFSTRKLAFSTGMIMAVWGFIGNSTPNSTYFARPLIRNKQDLVFHFIVLLSPTFKQLAAPSLVMALPT